jgi:hypothetical protein
MTLRNLHSSLSSRLRRVERGDGDSFEFMVGILPLAMLMMLIGAVTIIRPAQLPAWIAARECARMMAASLDQDVAEPQGERAALNSLERNAIAGVAGGFNIDTTYPDKIAHPNPRGMNASCTVSYVVPMADLPLVGGLFGNVPIDATVTMTIDPYKSDWKPKP